MYSHYPDITCYLQEQFTENIIDSLVQKEIDFGIIGVSDDDFSSRNDFKQLNSEPIYFQQLYVDSLVCVMSQNNPLSVYQSLYIKQLSTTKYTLYHCSNMDMINLNRQNCLVLFLILKYLHGRMNKCTVDWILINFFSVQIE